MSVPTHLSYTSEHEWLDLSADLATVGVTAYAADALGDIVYVDLPAVGAEVVGGEPCGELESTKSVSDLFAPADGVVVEVNDDLAERPELVNVDPYGGGWLFRLRLTGRPELLDAGGYEALTVGS